MRPHRSSLRTFLGAAGLTAGALLVARGVVRHSRRYDLRHKVALVTGGSRGLGLCIARELAEQGCRVAICARDDEELGRAKADLAYRGADILAVQCDLTVPAQVTGMIDGIRRHYGSIDILVNCAGVILVGPVEHMTLEDFDEAMKIHFYAPLVAVQSVLPDMLARGHGRIANITSIGGRIAVPHLLPYAASKFALAGYSEGLCAELRKNNIYVTTVVPGLMRTGSPRHALFKGHHRQEFTWFTLMDSMPGLSTSAPRAARRIVRALRWGQPELVLTLPAALAVRLKGVFSGTVAEVNALVARIMPAPGGVGQERIKGYDSQTELTRSALTTLTQRAARANNEQ